VIEIKRFSGCDFFAFLTKNGQICEIDLGSIADQEIEPRETRDGAEKAGCTKQREILETKEN